MSPYAPPGSKEHTCSTPQRVRKLTVRTQASYATRRTPEAEQAAYKRHRAGRPSGRNYLFARAHAGGKRAAIAYSVHGTYPLLGIKPREYLPDMLPRLTVGPLSSGTRAGSSGLAEGVRASRRHQDEASLRRPAANHELTGITSVLGIPFGGRVRVRWPSGQCRTLVAPYRPSRVSRFRCTGTSG